MSDAHILAAADGLALNIEPSGACRVGWGEPDWFGPAALTIHHAGRCFAGAHEPAPAHATALPTPRLSRFEDRDALGAYRAVELGWSGLPFPLRTVARAYVDRP